ncbi:MAG: CoA transferase subunit A [bacterium]|nr:CoA transferase subunit A [bacterium]
MKQICTLRAAVAQITDCASIMIGGFVCCGMALRLIDALLEQGTKELTIISNDAGYPDKGVGKLVGANRIRKLIASYLGPNPDVGRKMNSGELLVELVPQGTLAERIRCGGAGLGGILTPTGIGTEVERGKQIITVDGKQYLVEMPLRADFSFVKAHVCDKMGNAFIAKSSKNFNVVMAMAARHTIVETDELVEPGALDPERVSVPGVFVKTIAWSNSHE